MIGLLMLAATADGVARYIDGNHLYGWCTNDKPRCISYVLGAADALSAYRAHSKLPPAACTVGTTAGQVADVVAKYLRDNPAERHADGGTLVAIALGEAFPCAR